MTKIACFNCHADVWWSMPDPDDKCPECGERIGKPKCETWADHDWNPATLVCIRCGAAYHRLPPVEVLP